MRFAVLLALVAGCTAPNYGDGHLQCAADRTCPAGFYCAADEHCWRNDSGPPGAGDGGVDLAVPDDLAGVTLDLAGTPDLGGGPSKCSGSTALLCENFETPLALSTNGWQQNATTGSSATVDGTRAYRGAASLKSHIAAAASGAGPFATISTIKPFPIIGALYARVWVYFSPSLPASFEQFLNFTDAGSTGLSVATDTGFVTLDDYAGAQLYVQSTTKLPIDRWACIQLTLSQGSTTGAIQVSLDGKTIPELAVAGPTPTAVKVYLGVDFNNNMVAIPAYDAWFDELVIDNKPIACTD